MAEMARRGSSNISNAILKGDAGAVPALVGSPYWGTTIGTSSTLVGSLLQGMVPSCGTSSIASIAKSGVAVQGIAAKRDAARNILISSPVSISEVVKSNNSISLIAGDTDFMELLMNDETAFSLVLSTREAVQGITSVPKALTMIASDESSREAALASPHWGNYIGNNANIPYFILGILGLWEELSIPQLVTSGTVMNKIFADAKALEVLKRSSSIMSSISSTPEAMVLVASNENARNAMLSSPYWNYFNNQGKIARYTLAILGRDTEEFADFTGMLKDAAVVDEIVGDEAAMRAVSATPVAVSSLTGNPDTYPVIAGSAIAMKALAGSKAAMDTVASASNLMNILCGSAAAMDAITGSEVAMQSIVANYSYTYGKLRSNEVSVAAIAKSETALRAMFSDKNVINYYAKYELPLSYLMGSELAKSLLISYNAELQNYYSSISTELAKGNCFEVYREQGVVSNRVSDADITGKDLVVVATPYTSSDSSSYATGMWHGHDPSALVVRVNSKNSHDYIGIGGAAFTSDTGSYSRVSSTVYKVKGKS